MSITTGFGILTLQMVKGNFFATSVNHTLFVDKEGSVWGCGTNGYGELGTLSQEVFVPERIPNLPPIVSVAAGQGTSYLIDNTGNVWCCGDNFNGALGIPTAEEIQKPQKNPNLPRITGVFSGYSATYFLDEDAKIWVCGNNRFGQLGIGKKPKGIEMLVAVPRVISTLPKITSVSAGSYHSLALDEFGHVWTCGYNFYGQLGLGNYKNQEQFCPHFGLPHIIAISAGGSHSLLVDEDRNMWGTGSNVYKQWSEVIENNVSTWTICKGVKNVQQVSAGTYFSLVMDEECVWVYGLDIQEEIIKVKERVNIPDIISFYAGYYHSIFLDISGNVWTYGGNGYGKLGLGDKTSRTEPVQLQCLSGLLGPRKIPTKSANKIVI